MTSFLGSLSVCWCVFFVCAKGSASDQFVSRASALFACCWRPQVFADDGALGGGSQVLPQSSTYSRTLLVPSRWYVVERDVLVSNVQEASPSGWIVASAFRLTSDQRSST